MSKLKRIPEDAALPQLFKVLDEKLFAAHLERQLFDDMKVRVEAIKIKRVYYKPGKSCRLIFRLTCRTEEAGTIEQWYFARMLTRDKFENADRKARRTAWMQPQLGPAYRAFGDHSLQLWAYPNDPNVPGLRLFADPARMLQEIAARPCRFGLPAGSVPLELKSEIAKYVPGQRCGCRFQLRYRTTSGEVAEHAFFAKAYQPGLAQPAYRIVKRIEAQPAFQSGSMVTPRNYGYDPDNEVVWQEMISGRSFSKEASTLDLIRLAPAIASSLAHFHSMSLELGEGLGLQAELEELQSASDKIAEAYPEFAGRCEAVRSRLTQAADAWPETPRAPVHGSFKMSHVFQREEHGVAFIDFDGAGLGDPLYDVGRFLAHLVVAGINSKTDSEIIEATYRRFAESYGAIVPWGWQEARARWYTSALLLSSQAYKCVKRMVPDRVEAILAAAEAWFPDKYGSHAEAD